MTVYTTLIQKHGTQNHTTQKDITQFNSIADLFRYVAHPKCDTDIDIVARGMTGTKMLQDLEPLPVDSGCGEDCVQAIQVALKEIEEARSQEQHSPAIDDWSMYVRWLRVLEKCHVYYIG